MRAVRRRSNRHERRHDGDDRRPPAPVAARWIALATALLLAACLLALLTPILRLRSFIDENESVEVALHFVTQAQYGLILSKPNFDAFYPEMSIGLLANWPAALGWGWSGNLLGARVAVSAYCLLLAIGLGYAFVRTRVPAWRRVAPPVAVGCVLLALVMVPTASQAIVYALGEFSGAVVLGFGYLLLDTHPLTAALVLGLAVWHIKVIYAPYALLGIAFVACRHAAPALAWLRALAAQVALFVTPLLIWIALVRVRTGAAGLAEWVERRRVWYRFGHYSSLDQPVTIASLIARLASPKLEWAHYSTTAKLEILVLIFVPCAILITAVVARWRGRRRDYCLDLLQCGLCVGLLVSACWYFFFHQYMWVRHLLPALFVGLGVLLHLALTRLAALAPRRQAWLAGFVVLAVAIEAAPTWIDAIRLASSTSAVRTFPLKCRGDSPWQIGPWPRLECWEVTVREWP